MHFELRSYPLGKHLAMFKKIIMFAPVQLNNEVIFYAELKSV